MFQSSHNPDSNHLLGQRWHFVGSFFAPTATNDVSPMSFCSSGQLIDNRWFDVGPTPVAQQALHICQRNANHSLSSIALGKRWPDMIYGHHLHCINIYSLEIFYFPFTWCYWLQQFIP